jgi:transposase
MKPLSGNSSDARDFRAVITEHVKQLQEAHDIPYLVADSALFNQESLQEMQQANIKWLTRVPATLTEAKAALAQVNPKEFTPLAGGYSYQALQSSVNGSSRGPVRARTSGGPSGPGRGPDRDYAGVPQRWLLSYSEAANARAQKQVPKQLSRQSEADVKALVQLGKEAFACRDDAKGALETFTKKLKACTLIAGNIIEVPHYHKPGRPAVGAAPSRLSYRIEGHLATPLSLRDQRKNRDSCFILATNELDEDALPDHEVLAGYQGQASAERGFRFLKDPIPALPGTLFLASTLFLKKIERSTCAPNGVWRS